MTYIGKLSGDGQNKFSQIGKIGGAPIPPPPVPPGARWLPVVTMVQGLSAASVVLDTDATTPLAVYFGNSVVVGGVIHCTAELSITTDNSALQCQLNISNPVGGNFTLIGNAQICGLQSIVKNPNAVANTGSGWNGKLIANTSANSILAAFEASELSTTYIMNLSWVYIIK